MRLQRLANSLFPGPQLGVGVGLVAVGVVTVYFDRAFGLAFLAVGAIDLAWCFVKSRGQSVEMR